MSIELVATFALGLAVAGVVLLLQKLLRGRLPRWFMPAAAGLSMLGFQVWNEYAWFDRTTAALPAGIAIVSSHTESVPWRPWTYLMPQINRFSAVDVGNARRNPQQPGQVIAHVLLFARYTPTAVAPQLFDCLSGRRADLADGAEFADDGSVRDARWIDAGLDDPMLQAVCVT